MGQTVRDYLVSQVNAKLADAASIAELAESAARDMTDVEKSECKQLLDDVGKIKSQIQTIDDREELKASIDAIRGPVTTPVEEAGPNMTLGQAFLNSEGYKSIKAAGFTGKWTTGAIELPEYGKGFAGLGPDGMKTNVTEALSAIVVPEYQAGIRPLGTWPLRIADLMSSGNTNSNSLVYIEELAETNAAASVTEAALKPESAITFHTVTEPVQKIATFLPVSDEMLEDVAAIESYLNGRLSLFVQQTEETQLLSGDGTPPNISGITDRTIQSGSALSLDTDSVIDAIFKAMTSIRVTGLLEPDGIVMHPTDWSGVRLMKDSQHQYYGGGPFTGAYGTGGGMAPNNLWGLPVVVTTSIAQGTALVGAFRAGAQVFRRRGLTVEASNSHSDFFQRNMTAIRAEERLALAVYRPLAFYRITGVDQLMGS